MKNANLINAKSAKNDEFYTRYADIANELKHYERHFAGKVVYCNCDDPAKSNFVKYFRANRARLGLRGLLINHLRPDGTGDFRSKEATAKLAEADIVCTNPPFSLFRQYIAQLVDTGGAPLDATPKDKKFLIIGNMNQITSPAIFDMRKQGRIAGGTTWVRDFVMPCGRAVNMGGAIWFSNMTHGKTRQIPTICKYNPAIHPTYDNYPAINVDKIAQIPRDYEGLMGVPITFLIWYNTAEFDIIDSKRDAKINGKNRYKRVIIQRKMKGAM